MGPNGNLSLEERSKLAPGTEVVWQSERGPEKHGVVSHTNGSGSLVTMEDGGAADYNAFLRLASWKPAVAQQKPAKAPEAASPAKTAEQPPVPAKATRKVVVGEKGNTPWNKGRPKVDAERWLLAVMAVRAGMDAGRSCESEIAVVAKAYPDLRLSLASFSWWQRRLIKEGTLSRRPKTMPKREVAPAGECKRCLALAETRDAAVRRCEALEADRDRAVKRAAEATLLLEKANASADESMRRAMAANTALEAKENRPGPAEPFAALAACLVRIAALAPATQGRIVRAMAEIIGE